MECETCHRSEPDRLFYCSACLAARLADHRHHRLKLLDSLNVQTRRAEHLLRPPQAQAQAQAGGEAPSPAAGHRLGMEEERFKKADKWTLAVKVRDTRLLKDELSGRDGEVRASLLARRTALDRRKLLLTEARALLRLFTQLDQTTTSNATDSSPPPPTMPPLPPAPPAALAALSANHSATFARHANLCRQAAQTRTILTRELLSIYGFGPVTPSPSASALSPFVNPHSESDTDTEQAEQRARPPLPTYSVAGLPLPPLSQLVSLPPAVLSASVSHVLHLTRLLALYTQQDALPFTPFPSLYGQGLPGLRAAPGWPAASSPADASSTPAPARPSSSTKPRAYPLFVSRKHVPASIDPDADSTGFGSGVTLQESENQGGFSGLSRSGEGDASMRAREKWARAVRQGVIALAYDLAWLAWRQGHPFDGTLSELEDLGGLVLKAAAPPKARAQAADAARHSGADAQPGSPAQGPAGRFAFDFDALAAEFVAGLEGAGGDGAESVVLVAKPGAGAGAQAGEAEEEEWDWVEAGV